MDYSEVTVPINFTEMKNKNLLPAVVYLLLASLLLFSCKMNLTEKDSISNEWNSGTITIAADENLKNILQQLVQIYEFEHKNAKVILNFQPQDKIITDFINGDIKSMIVSRNLTEDEMMTSQENQTVKITAQTFAYNAVALIANNAFRDSIIDIRTLRDYLNPSSPIKLVFDNQRSGIAKLVMEKAAIEKALFKNALVVNNTKEVVDYVSANPHTIGFIPFNMISDKDDNSTSAVLSKVKLLSIQHDDVISGISQESIYAFTYPLQQSLTIVLGNNPELTGRGFSNFLCREKASKILLKAGLVPRFMPTRRINILDNLKSD